jgi:haloalkane dehalogenase
VSDDADWRAEYPFMPRAFDVGGLKLNYVDEGSGPVLLFVHGNPTWSFAWRNLLKDLSRDYRVIAVDHIGCGLSDKPQKKYGYVLENHISNLVRLVDALDLRGVTLVGHDWGGCIGMGTAARRPDRFSRFVLMNTAAFRSRRIPLRIAVCRIPVLGAIAVRGFNAFARAALFMAVEHRKRFTKRARAGFIAPYNSWANRIATHEFVKDIPLAARHRSYETLLEVETGLARFRDKPMLLLWGERDWCFTMHFYREWRRRFPEAKTITYPDAGHYVFEDAIDRMIPDVRAFLGETQKGK